jgi:dephospho-CoA kinase
VLSDSNALQSLENIVHPLVGQEREKFYIEACRNGYFAVIYDIPLLFENGLESTVDYTLVVSASAETQRTRVLQRTGMTLEKFESILAKQLPDNVKRSKANYIVNTDYPGYCEAKAQISQIIEEIINSNLQHYNNWKQLFKSNQSGTLT